MQAATLPYPTPIPATLADLDSLADPFTPPTRPGSALSAASDTSHFALHDEGPSPATAAAQEQAVEYLPLRMIVETIRRHKGMCLLCGRKEDLTVMRAALQHGVDEANPDPIPWLQRLKLLSPEYTRDDWTNLMTLCKTHARAYEDDVWRWVPGAAFRAEMARATPTAGTPRAEKTEGDVAMGVEIDDDAPPTPNSELVETLVDDGISGQTRNPEIRFQPMELPYFDVLILAPELMPAPPTPGSAAGADLARVWHNWRPLTLNPYVAYAAALTLLARTPEGSNGDGTLGAVRGECLAVRDAWEARAAEGVA